MNRALLLFIVILSLGGTCKGKEGISEEMAASPDSTRTEESEIDVQTRESEIDMQIQEMKPCQTSLDKKFEAWVAFKTALIKEREAYVSYDFAIHKIYARELSGRFGLTADSQNLKNTTNAYLSNTEKFKAANSVYQKALQDYQNCISSSVDVQEEESEACQAAAMEWHIAWSDFYALSNKAIDKYSLSDKAVYFSALEEKDTAYTIYRLTLKVYQKCD